MAPKKERRPRAPKPQSPPPPPSSSSPAEEEEDSNSNPGPSPVQINWDLLTAAIKTATRLAYASSPPFSRAAADAFRSYWYGVYTRLAADVGARGEIPHHLTLPAVKKFNVTLYDESGAGGCPCCLPELDPEVELVNDQGVNKVDFVLGLRDVLYGKRDRRVAMGEMQREEDEEGEGGEEVDRLVFDAEWMMGPVEGPEGERYTHQFCYGEDAEDVCTIWVFWSTWGRFRENVRNIDKVRESRVGRDIGGPVEEFARLRVGE